MIKKGSVKIPAKRSGAPVRTDPALWERCKKEAVEAMGRFSARAMQRAVMLYKQRGGGYLGQKSDRNALVRWGKKQSEVKIQKWEEAGCFHPASK